jgi:hypothetical protein
MSVERIRRFIGLFAIVFVPSCAGRMFETARGDSNEVDGGDGAKSGGGSGGNQSAAGGRRGSVDSGGVLTAAGGAGAAHATGGGAGELGGGAGNGGSETAGRGGSPSAGGVIVSTGATFGSGGAPSTGGMVTSATGGASTSTGGSAVTGGGPSTGGLASNTGGVAPGTGGASTGGAPGCQSSVDCSYCCAQEVPSGSTGSSNVVFSLALYGCACSACYSVCDSSLCNAQAPLPSIACLSCIRANSGGGECKSEWDQCTTDPVCGAFGSCAFACL